MSSVQTWQVTPALDSAALPVHQISFLQDLWRRYKRNRLALIGAGVVLVLVVLALFASLVAPYSPTEVNLDIQFVPPSLAHVFGTDFYGRDVLSRVIHGARISLMIGLIPSAISMLMHFTADGSIR